MSQFVQMFKTKYILDLYTITEIEKKRKMNWLSISFLWYHREKT